jgi:hypothetical protein
MILQYTNFISTYIRFIPPEQSPNGQPLLLVAGAASGTLTLLRVTGLQHQSKLFTFENQIETDISYFHCQCINRYMHVNIFS